MYQIVTGNGAHKILELHEKYGPVVRVGVNELCYINQQAWNDIYGQRGGLGQMEKAGQMGQEGFGVYDLVSASSQDHARCRRLLSHAFSDKALREHEPLMTTYVDLLMQRLDERAGDKVDIMTWFNYTTFDVMGDLTFSESFNCLRDVNYHWWISLIFSNMKALAWTNVAKQVPGLTRLLMKLAPKDVIEKSLAHVELCKRQATKRLAENTDRPDIMSYIIRHNDKVTGMSVPEIQANSYVLIIGGSETTATLLSGAVYFLLRNPSVMAKLTSEIRTAFKAESEISFVTVSKLQMFIAVLAESLRIYPPVPWKLARAVPPSGAIVDGSFVPGGTWVSICHYAAAHSSLNFTDPETFAPERWTGDPRFANDRRDAHQPFSYGPRNCLGRNLAYMEMRLILARLLWNFDLELCPESMGWFERQKTYILWEKDRLWVRCRRVVR